MHFWAVFFKRGLMNFFYALYLTNKPTKFDVTIENVHNFEVLSFYKKLNINKIGKYYAFLGCVL